MSQNQVLIVEVHETAVFAVKQQKLLFHVRTTEIRSLLNFLLIFNVCAAENNVAAQNAMPLQTYNLISALFYLFFLFST